jgi:plasmid stability protein
MSMLQVRDLSENTHQVLKIRAAKARMSLSDYVARELDAIAERPTMDEWLDQVRSRENVNPGISAREILLQERKY